MKYASTEGRQRWMRRRNLLCGELPQVTCSQGARAQFAVGDLRAQYQRAMGIASGLPARIDWAWENVPNGAYIHKGCGTSHCDRVRSGKLLPQDIKYRKLQAKLTACVMHLAWICQQGLQTASSLWAVHEWMDAIENPRLLEFHDNLDATDELREWLGDNIALLDSLPTFGGEPLDRTALYTTDNGIWAYRVRSWNTEQVLITPSCSNIECIDGCTRCSYIGAKSWESSIIRRDELEPYRGSREEVCQ